MDWTQVLSVFAVVATNLATVLVLYMHQDTKIEAHARRSQDILEAIRKDMSDFHGRLCAIEERNRSKS